MQCKHLQRGTTFITNFALVSVHFAVNVDENLPRPHLTSETHPCKGSASEYSFLLEAQTHGSHCPHWRRPFAIPIWFSAPMLTLPLILLAQWLLNILSFTIQLHFPFKNQDHLNSRPLHLALPVFPVLFRFKCAGALWPWTIFVFFMRFR